MASLVSPPPRKTRSVVMNAALAGSRCSSCSRWNVSTNERPFDQRLDGEHPAGERPQPRPRQPADQVLGEHREPFLQLLVPGEPRVELLERLLLAVEVGEQVRADFVVQQRLDAVARHRCRRRDEQPIVRDHHARRDVVADFDLGDEARQPLVVVVDLVARGGDELLGVEA